MKFPPLPFPIPGGEAERPNQFIDRFPGVSPPPQVSGKTASERVMALVQIIDKTHRFNIYQSKPHIKLEEGNFRLDCSALVGWILSGTAPEAFREVRLYTPAPQVRPIVKNFVAALSSISPDRPTVGWRRIQKISDARAGDVIAWPTPDWYPSRASGHMGIVVGKPEPVPGGFLVRIADSTSYPHGQDSRQGGSGFGYGTVLITTDPVTGAGVGQGWTGRYSEATVIRTPILVGRPLS